MLNIDKLKANHYFQKCCVPVKPIKDSLVGTKMYWYCIKEIKLGTSPGVNLTKWEFGLSSPLLSPCRLSLAYCLWLVCNLSAVCLVMLAWCLTILTKGFTLQLLNSRESITQGNIDRHFIQIFNKVLQELKSLTPAGPVRKPMLLSNIYVLHLIFISDIYFIRSLLPCLLFPVNDYHNMQTCICSLGQRQGIICILKLKLYISLCRKSWSHGNSSKVCCSTVHLKAG